LPERTALNTSEYNEITLKIYWGDGTNLSPDWDIELDTIDSVVCDVVSLERLPAGVQEETQVKQRMIDTEQSAAITEGMNFILPENTMVKTLGVITRDENGLRTDVAVGEMRLTHTNDEVTLRKMDGPQVQSQNKSYYNVENVATGFYVFELDKDHDFTELFDTKGKNYARLHVDPNATPITSTAQLFRRVITTPAQLTN